MRTPRNLYHKYNPLNPLKCDLRVSGLFVFRGGFVTFSSCFKSTNKR